MAVTTYDSSGVYIFPSEYDVNGGIPGYGRVPQETTLNLLTRLAARQGNCVIGWTPPGIGVGRNNFDVQGQAGLLGYAASTLNLGKFTISFPYAVNWVYLKLLKLSTKVTGLQIQVHDAVQLPGPGATLSTPLWKVTIASELVSAVTDYRRRGQVVQGAFKTGGTVSDEDPGTCNWHVVKSGDTYTVYFAEEFYKAPLELNKPSPTTVIYKDRAEFTTTFSVTVSFRFVD